MTTRHTVESFRISRRLDCVIQDDTEIVFRTENAYDQTF